MSLALAHRDTVLEILCTKHHGLEALRFEAPKNSSIDVPEYVTPMRMLIRDMPGK